MLQLRKEGVAYAHLTLPTDTYSKEAAAIEGAIGQLGPVCRAHSVSYRGVGCAAEEEVVDAVYAAAAPSMRIEVHAGFGWSDLIAAGAFTNASEFVNFIRRIERLRVAASGGIEAFRRVLTLVGYDH